MTHESDDDNRSPRLEAQKINYYPDEQELPPFVSRRSSDDTGAQSVADTGTSPDCSRKHLQHLKPNTALGDSVLINYLDPSRHDIANYERDHPLNSARASVDLDRLKETNPKSSEAAEAPSNTDLAARALNLLDYDTPNYKGSNGTEPVKTEFTSPKTKLPRLTTKKDETSPLKLFAIPASERPAQELLPALQSPPQSVSAATPENQQNLPSIHSALGELPDISPKESVRSNGTSQYAVPPVPGASPPGSRYEMARDSQTGQFPPPQIPLSPYSHFSPASSKDMSNMSSPASQPPYWRSRINSDIQYVTSSYEASLQTTKSPATSYPTPTDHPGSERTSFSMSSQSSGTITAGIFKCRHPGCTAQPFQTQYLLK